MTFRWRLDSLAAAGAAAVVPSGLLSEREREILAGLAFPARRRKWLAGRLASKRLLAEELSACGAPAALEDVTILNEPSGAPYAEIHGRGRWSGSLSISHRGDRGFSALVDDRNVTVGADIETVEPRDPALVRQFFTEGESARVEHAGDAGALEVARIWSAKEAVLKALGLGLRLDTRQIEIGPPVGVADDEGWHEVGVTLERGAAAAVAGRPLLVRWRHLDGCVATIALLGRREPTGQA